MRTNRYVRLLAAALTIAVLAGAAPAFVAASTPTGRVAATQVVAAPCHPGASACPIKLNFGHNDYTAQRSSTLTGINSERWFVVKLKAGQQVIVLVEGKGPTRGVVYFPNGQQDGQPGGRVFDGTVPVSGNYRIRVTESSMAQAWHGRVDVVVVAY